MRKPRLLVVASTYPRWPGDDSPAFVHQLASRLTGRFDVAVSTSRAPGAVGHETIGDVEVFRYAYAPAPLETLVHGGGLVGNLRAQPWKLLLLPGFLLGWILQLRALHRRFHFDAVHAHWFIPGAIVAACAIPGVPLCVTAHGTDVLRLRGGAWTWLRRRVAARARVVTAVGTALRDALQAEGIAPVEILPMGVDLSGTFVPGARRGPGTRLLFVGRLVAAKRPEVALHAFRDILRTRPEMRLDVVGDGPERVRLERLASELGIGEAVSFHGRQGHAALACMYREAAGLLVPSGSPDAPEGLGLAAIEALGCGCPVVSVPNSSLQSLLPEGTPIRYARDASAGAIAAATLAMLDEAGARPFDPRGPWRETLAGRFGWNAVAARYGDLLASLVAPGG